ncbi:hypothetical protein EOA33_12430 [Mesorhizobium sp. M4A.F.Ca.ET.050.02.1.1]|uniref:hypothetical protein n=2 Tax=unclassified Mesorhizobium TaxID=325217 RepID=UPI000FCB505B|nr:hypothetical protein [Mesorhizobium sp. M4A.F.Ca.ET.050.02.1.1]RUX49477.1 hypothetical protein EOA33_12430 [Mesorhizobium sp. M4A.F.Ca.ET.050.02.1.1]TIT95854.1 MAG: hypothetical protein E5W59_00770 [Mesorhizobium sp.]
MTKITVPDTYFFNKPLAKMSSAEREMLRQRVNDTADALDNVTNSEFAELVAIRVLERRGMQAGTVDRTIDETPTERQEEAKKSSIYARQSGLSRRGE